jgi:excisionase family DNA binding protein
MTDPLSVTQAAARLGITPGRVVQLIARGDLPAERLGRMWLLDPQVVAVFTPRPTGYPKGRKRK